MCEVKLEGNHKFSQKQQKYRVSEDLKEGEARTLFSESPPRAARHTQVASSAARAGRGLRPLGHWLLGHSCWITSSGPADARAGHEPGYGPGIETWVARAIERSANELGHAGMPRAWLGAQQALVITPVPRLSAACNAP